jgi:hypothetical protein
MRGFEEMNNTKCEKLVNDVWVGVKIKELKDNDIFRVYTIDNRLIKNSNGSEELRADGDAYKDKEGQWSVCIW